MRERLVWAVSVISCLVAVACAGSARCGESAPLAVARGGRAQTALRVREAFLSHASRGERADLPIGLFDSGTGGLAVLEAVLRLDEFDNVSHLRRSGGDGQLDFAGEQFVFLADQANMPYGNYPSAGNSDFLAELARNDAAFLLLTEYSDDSVDNTVARDKRPAKAVLIACNTATAYGKREIESLIEMAEIDVPVVNVIDAGARGAVEAIEANGPGAIGVIATAGTVESGAYPAAIQAMAAERRQGVLQVVQQGSVGLAGAIDEIPDFISREARTPRVSYRGPSLSHPTAWIDPALLPRYAFEFADQGMLLEGDADSPRQLQINSVGNYIAYEMVTLLEKLRTAPHGTPLSVVVLGCTHFPYHQRTFRRELERLRNYRENGQFLYRPWIRESVVWIDPARITARRLYECLSSHQLLRSSRNEGTVTRGEFYITIPNARYSGVQLDHDGGFSYEYKYGRKPGVNFEDVCVVPLTQQRFPAATVTRLQSQLPGVWKLLCDFGQESPKCRPVRGAGIEAAPAASK